MSDAQPKACSAAKCSDAAVVVHSYPDVRPPAHYVQCSCCGKTGPFCTTRESAIGEWNEPEPVEPVTADDRKLRARVERRTKRADSLRLKLSGYCGVPVEHLRALSAKTMSRLVRAVETLNPIVPRLTKLHIRVAGTQFAMTFEPADSNGDRVRISHGPHFGAMEDEQLLEWAFEGVGVTAKREKNRLRKLATIYRDRDDRPDTKGGE